MTSTPHAIVFNDGTSTNLYVFVTDTDGEVHSRYWSGNEWKWANHGQPGSVEITSAPFVLASRQIVTGVNPHHLLYIFARGHDGRLHHCRWNRRGWVWEPNLGRPPNTYMIGRPSAVSVNWSPTGDDALRHITDNIHVFVRGADNHLYGCFWDRSAWNWVALDRSPSLTSGSEPGLALRPVPPVVVGAAPNASGTEASIIASGPTASQPRWERDSTSAGAGLHLLRKPGTVSYFYEGRQTIYSFFQAYGPNNDNNLRHLPVWRWDEVNGNHWHDLYNEGTPPQTGVASEPAAVVYRHGDSEKIYVFFIDTRGDLRVIFWNGSIWQWGENHGKPPNNRRLVRNPSAVKYFFGEENLYVFVVDDLGNLWERNWFPRIGHWRWGSPHNSPP